MKGITTPDFEVVIIGGSYAGLAAGLAFGRSMRTTLIIDNGTPANRFTSQAHNLLTHDGKTPGEISLLAKQDLEPYKTVEFCRNMVTGIEHGSKGFHVTTSDARVVTARKVLFATGITDKLPAIVGLDACWGTSVLHCPYCHGYEYRQQPTGILASGAVAFEFAKLISNWTKDLHVLTNNEPGLDTAMVKELEKHAVKIHSEKIISVQHSGGHLENVLFKNGKTLQLNAMYARPEMIQQTSLPQSLGCEMNDHLLKVDGFQQTTVPGIYAAGDNCSMMRSLAGAIASGSFAGASINRQLITEDF